MPARVATVTCAHQEEAALPGFLAFHAAIGVDRAFVYLDRCTDGSRAAVDASPVGVAVEADRPDTAAFLLEHQRACAQDALDRCRAEGVDWLLQLDVDEYAYGRDPDAIDLGLPGAAGRGRLPALLDAVALEVEAVALASLEALPVTGATHPWDLHHVQSPADPVTRHIVDPRTDEVVVTDRLLGHDQGKWAVRVAAGLTPVNAHVWHGPDGRPACRDGQGTLLHVPVVSPGQWRAKYAKLAFEPDHWPRGLPVPFPKQAWKELTPAMAVADADDYFHRWVALAPDELAAALAEGRARHLPLVERVLTEAGFLDPAAPS